MHNEEGNNLSTAECHDQAGVGFKLFLANVFLAMEV